MPQEATLPSGSSIIVQGRSAVASGCRPAACPIRRSVGGSEFPRSTRVSVRVSWAGWPKAALCSSLARLFGGNGWVPYRRVLLAQSVNKAVATCKSWQPEDLSHRDLFVITRPIDNRRHYSGLRLGILNLNCVTASFGHRPSPGLDAERGGAYHLGRNSRLPNGITARRPPRSKRRHPFPRWAWRQEQCTLSCRPTGRHATEGKAS